MKVLYIFSLLFFITHPAYSGDLKNNCEVDTLIEKSNMRFLEIDSIENSDDLIKISLLYEGMSRIKNSKNEGRRVISNLSKCYKVKYKTRKTLSSYSLVIDAKRK